LERRRQERQSVQAKGKQAKLSTPAKATRFLSVQVAAESKVGDLVGVEILLGKGRAIRVRPGFDRQTLADVLAVLEASPC
jgi:hypothetical protein